MKSKIAAILLGVTLTASNLTGYADASASEKFVKTAAVETETASEAQEAQEKSGLSSQGTEETADGQKEKTNIEGQSDGTEGDGSNMKPGGEGEADGKGGPGGNDKPDGNGRPDGNDKPDGDGGPGGSDKPDGSGGPGGPGGMDQSQGVDSYDSVTEYTEDTQVEGETFTSTGTDENAVHILDGASVSLKDSDISRISSDSTGGDASSFYGVGAALLATDGKTVMTGGRIDTDAAGGAGLFAYGSGTIYADSVQITTKQDTSGGIHVAGGGTLYAWDLTVETSGESSAAIRSDRGSGTMVVDGGSYTSNGTGSPAVYSTADISVHGASLTAAGSEAVCIEGLNTLRLYDCSLTGNMSDLDQNDCTWNIILYQSMSGDSEVGNSTFEMDGGSLTAENGGMFYTTNTECTFTLSNVDITYAEDNDFFLKCTGNNNQRGWGTSGDNGSDCLFTAISQQMNGDIVWDSISRLDLYLSEGSSLTGAVLDDESCAGTGGDGYCCVYIDNDSTWTVTGDSVLTSLYCAGTIADESGNTVTVKGTDGTVYVDGTSAYTITAESYGTTADMSGSSEMSSWDDYSVEKNLD